ncbi:MAG: MFS transporter, partial [Rhodospirillaceae bacterium]|nr:MFS transporter [Rhodospirillaceae bacterium]
SMARYFDEDRGKAAGVAGTGYALGYAIFPLIGAWLLTSFGWRDAWSLSGWFVLLIILPLIMVQLWGHGTRHRAYEAKLISLSGDTAKNPVQQWTLSDVLSDARFWLLQPSMVVVPCVVFSIQFHQLFLVETKGWNLTAFAGSYSLYAAVSLFATLTCGSLIDRYKSHRLIRFCVLPLVPALVALAVFDSPLIIPVVMALTGMTFGLSLVVYVTIWAELYGTKHMGAIRSFNIFFNVTIASGVMVLTGWLIDQGTTIAMMAIGGVVFVAISLICLEIAGRLPNRRLQGAP